MQSLLGELADDADIVIVDTTPLLAVSDAYPLLDKASGIVALVRLDKTPRDAIRRMLQIAASTGGRVLGVVATDGKRVIRGGGYGYGYGAGYGDTGKKGRAGKKGSEAPVEAPVAVPNNGGSPGLAPSDLRPSDPADR
jgi:Mrp family chromosome partitioning ATPase